MKKFAKSPAKIVWAMLLMALVIVAVVALPRTALGAAGKIDDLAMTRMTAEGKANVFVKMASDVSLAGAENITDRADRLNYVHDTLLAHANATQKDLLAYLDSQGARYHSFWINNSVYIWDATLDLAREIARRGDVSYIRGERAAYLDMPVVVAENTDSPEAIEWGVSMINANDVWALGYTGNGIVVSNVDSGVRWTHDALDNQYRGSNGNHDYDWWDPQETQLVPTDGLGHGTHTMGTMVGDDGGSNQIGVAPDAQWIAAQGCNSSGYCFDFDLTSSAEFIECPTDVNGNNPNCALAPHVVNNSWGDSFGGDNWYQSYVNAWHAAGIMPVFSAGNNGSSCSSMGSPGDYRNVVGVGAVDINQTLAWFSSRGPGDFNRQKPDVVAPGDNVRSAYNTSDTAYANLSGTSMAAPHTAGAFALMMDKSIGSNRDMMLALRNNTVQGLPNPPNPDTCSGKSYTVYPNFHYGYGLIDVLAAINNWP